MLIRAALGLLLVTATPVAVHRAVSAGGTVKTYVQSATANSGGTCTTCTLTFSSPIGSGHAVVGAILYQDPGNTRTVSSIVDDKGNSYIVGAKVFDTAGGSNLSQAIFWRGNIPNGPTVLTATMSASTGTALQRADEYSGSAALVDPSDGTNSNYQITPPVTTDAVTSGTFTTTVINDLIWSVSTGVTGVLNTAGTGFTGRGNILGYVATEDKNLAAAGSTAGTWTYGGSGNVITQAVAIK